MAGGGKKDKGFSLDQWLGRDLVDLAAKGELARAWEVEDRLGRMEAVLAIPGQSPVLTGPPGIGKSSLLSGLAWKLAEGKGPPSLRGSRIRELRLRRIKGRYPRDWDKRLQLIGRIFEACRTAEPPIVPWISDFDHIYELDFEDELERFIEDGEHVFIGEGSLTRARAVANHSGVLAQRVVVVPLAPPRSEQVHQIVAAWAAHEAEREVDVETRAWRHAVALTDRFLVQPEQPAKVLTLLRQAVASLGAPPASLSRRALVEHFGSLTQVPARLTDPDERLDLDELRAFLSARLLGQGEAVEALVRMVALIKAGLSDSRRPFGVLLFVGPTGVGKTHATQLLATYLFGSRTRVLRLNMADYSKPEHVGLLLGVSGSQDMSLRRGRLHALLRSQAFGVLLLDELEKASTEVHDALLQLIDEGSYTNGAGEIITASSFIIVATSNAGAEVYRESGLGFGGQHGPRSLARELDRRLHQQFRFEFLNRFDQIVHFHPLDRRAIRSIAERELTELLARPGVVDRELRVEVDVAVLDWLVSHGWHPHWGARFLRREMERHVTAALATAIVREHPKEDTGLRIKVKGDQVVVETLRPSEPKRVRLALPELEGETVRRLDRPALLGEAQAWLDRWHGAREGHEGRQEEHRQLTEASLAADFWKEPGAAQEVLRRWGALDARVQVEQRLLATAAELELVLGDAEASDEALARAIEGAARSWRQWLERREEGGSAAWLVIEAADAGTVPQAWLEELVSLYRRWLERCGLRGEVVAEEVEDELVGRVVFEVEGPGVVALLAMEAGVHRRERPQGGRERLRVRVLVRREPEPSPGLPRGAHLEDARHVAGRFVGMLRARLTIEQPERGVTTTLLGTDRETLRLLAADLAQAGSESSEEARVYGLQGGTVQDPRTGAPRAELRRVLRGQLDGFLEAWQRRDGAQARIIVK